MREEFLSYRFVGLKKPDQILSQCIDVGWKCRKYIRWRQVHNTSDDGMILKSFADDLIENQRIDLSLYGRISSILLNVQRWRLDRNELSIEPPPNEAWEYVHTLLQVVNSSPQVITQWLAERSPEIPESATDIQLTFYLRLLDHFLSNQTGSSYVPFTDQTIVFHENAELAHAIAKQFRPVYKSVGLKAPTAANAGALIERIYKDFGFEGALIQSDLNLAHSSDQAVGNQVFITYRTLDTSKLLRVTSRHGNIFVELNGSHPFIQHVLELDQSRDVFEAFFKCYAMSVIDTISLSSAVDTFTSYLETHLRQEFVGPYN